MAEIVRYFYRFPRKYAVLALVFAAQAAGLLLLAKPMAPVKKGTSATFWHFACSVGPGGRDAALDGVMGGGYQPRDGWYIYYIQDLHRRLLYRVERAEAVADYPDVLQSIVAAAGSPQPAPRVLRASRILKEDEPGIRANPEVFLARMAEEWLLKIKSEDEKVYEAYLDDEREFAARWERVGRYWLNLLFEAAFFTSLTLFAFWPWLRRKALRRWCIHVGLLPLLLFAPWYFGYAGWTFTSAGPSGGVLYPWVIVLFRGLLPWTHADTWILERTAHILDPISQPLGPMLVVSGGTGVGPVAAVVTGLILAGLTWGAFKLHERWRKASRPGITCPTIS
ncbi:MAG: hypothetical protein RBS80_01505 [Thermoguttaceae bacterium]|nr:hypothetical protein [Thermoguttaceae bacterium]